MTSLRETFESGRPIGALWLSVGSPAIAELAGAARPDLIVIDRQHGLWDRATLEAGIGHAAREAPVMVRLADHSATSISEALDAGAEAVLAPLVETAEQARAIVSAARFPPQGTRSGGGVRPGRNFAAYVERMRRDAVVGAMIETRAGLEQAEAIAAVDGVDFLFIGVGDLALSLGEFPAFGKAHESACATILAACRRVGKPCSAFTFGPAAAARFVEQGFRLVTVGNDLELVRDGFVEAAKALKETGAGQ